jgi:hypothetical protein
MQVRQSPRRNSKSYPICLRRQQPAEMTGNAASVDQKHARAICAEIGERSQIARKPPMTAPSQSVAPGQARENLITPIAFYSTLN